ncbi:hypothetical protein DBR24_27365 [Pseudomonas sp. HMWF006]|nr:hypothetical protein DBR24_27365 [Pseudomonas sp. HMWF006]PTT63641.1 hypothetical protein DBR26_22320 [Pseudomonas sp. HMWF007]PTT92221.1 hypothetical protein DBR29_09600 [Pseudomonas sp. HMWF005]
MFEVHRPEIPESNCGFESKKIGSIPPLPLAIPEPSSDFEKHIDLLPFPLYPLGERAGVRGMDLKPTTKIQSTAQTKKP